MDLLFNQRRLIKGGIVLIFAVFSLILRLSLPLLAQDDLSTCTYQEQLLYGKVKIVEHFPDFKVKVVSSFPDLKVKWVSAFADDCGEWQQVESFPDFTVQFVESFPDFTVQFVESFPGVS